MRATLDTHNCHRLALCAIADWDRATQYAVQCD